MNNESAVSYPSQKKISVTNAFAVANVSDNYKLVSPKEEKALILAWQEKRDGAALSKLLKIHDPFLIETTNFHARKHPQIDRDDIWQEAQAGFIIGVGKYDPSFNVKLLTYAGLWMNDGINTFITKNRVIQKRRRHIKPSHKIIIDRYNELMDEHNRRTGGLPPTLEQRAILSQQLGCPLSKVKDLLIFYYAPALSLDQPINDNGEVTLLDLEADSRDDPFEIEAQASELRFLRKLIEEAELTERERQVITKRYLEDKDSVAPFEDVGRALGITLECVRQTEIRALRKMLSYADRLYPSETSRINPDVTQVFGSASQSRAAVRKKRTLSEPIDQQLAVLNLEN